MSQNRPTTDLFKIDDMPMVTPDQGVPFSYEDIDSADTGRDEKGVMHRDVVLFKVGKWAFTYTNISQSDYVYMEGLFINSTTHQPKASFNFTRPSQLDLSTPKVTECYRSKYSLSADKLSANNLTKYKLSSYSFDIIEMSDKPKPTNSAT